MVSWQGSNAHVRQTDGSNTSWLSLRHQPEAPSLHHASLCFVVFAAQYEDLLPSVAVKVLLVSEELTSDSSEHPHAADAHTIVHNHSIPMEPRLQHILNKQPIRLTPRVEP